VGRGCVKIAHQNIRGTREKEKFLLRREDTLGGKRDRGGTGVKVLSKATHY